MGPVVLPCVWYAVTFGAVLELEFHQLEHPSRWVWQPLQRHRCCRTRLSVQVTAVKSDDWQTQIIRRMAGERAVSRETPGTRAFGQKKYVEPLAEYLAQR